MISETHAGSYRLTLHYDEPLIRRAIFAVWRRWFPIRFLIAYMVVVIGLGHLFSLGDRSWRVGALAGILLTTMAFRARAYLAYYRARIREFRAKAGSIDFIIDSEGFTLTSSEGTATFPWSTINETWQSRDFWLLFVSKTHFIILRLSDIPLDARAFIIERVQQHGGTVR